MKKQGSCSRRDLLKGVSLLTPALLAAGAGKAAGFEYVKNRHGERMIERYPDFKDARSRKVVFLAHCILNQNARINSCAYTPATIPNIAEELVRRGIGMAQMPCPELGCLGLGRGGPVEIYDQLSTPGARRKLREYAHDTAYQIKQYRKHGFRVLGVLGIDGSPSCGVELTYYKGEGPGTGAYIEELLETMKKEGLSDIPVKGVQDAGVEAALKLIGEWDTA